MQYAKVRTPVREALVALEPINGGAAFQKLFDQTDISGWEEWLAYTQNNFNNAFQKADEARYNARGPFAIILRDIMREGGRGTDGKGRLNVDYVSHAGTEWEKHHDLWAPESGYWVPTEEGVFHEGTLVPFETVENMTEAVKRLEAKGTPAEQVAFFYRLDNYRNVESFVGRDFDPGLDGDGRFGVLVDWLPSRPGGGGVASRQAYDGSENPEIVMRVPLLEKAA